ncbi:MAG: metallophosphoesterase [Clostridia bacterium]|nr:metallophosphoesterase [Clostridia bacterium]
MRKKIIRFLGAALTLAACTAAFAAEKEHLSLPLPEGAFTVVVVPDTQNMTLFDFGGVRSIGKWIAENKEARNILIAVHTGDIVTGGLGDKNWEKMSPALASIREQVPFLTAAGNHDVGGKAFLYDYYRKWRPDTELPEEQLFEGGKCSWRTVESPVGELLFVAVGSFDVKDEAVYEWVNGVLAAHKDTPAFLVTHDYLLYNAELSGTGKYLFERVVVPNPNVKYVFCGHNADANTRVTELDDDGDGTPDRTVYQLLMNMQRDDRKTGYFRILTFLPDGSLDVACYSAFLDDYDYFTKLDPRESFTIERAF